MAEKLEDEITCSLCLAIYQEPRKLPCDHVYCTGCIQSLAQLKKDNSIECPQCRKLFQVPNSQVSEFPVAFHMNRLKDVYNDVAKTLRHASITSQNKEASANNCSEHRGQPIAMFCETCSELICRDCVLNSKKHEGHQTGFIEQIAERVRGELDNFLVPLKEMECKASLALEKLRQTREGIKSQGEIIQQSIDIAFTEIMAKLQEEKAALEKEAADKNQEKTTNINQQAKEIQQSRSQLQTALASIETAVKVIPESELVSTQSNIKSTIKTAQSDFKFLDLIPCELVDIGIETSTPEAHANIWRENSYTYKLSDPKKCTVLGAPLSYLETNAPGLLEVSILDSKGRPCIGKQSISVDLHQVRDKAPGIMKITNLGVGQYRLTLQMANRGRYKLSIEVNGQHIARSPYEIFVTKPPIHLGMPVKKIGNLKSPSGLTYNEDKLIISNHDHDQLTIIDSQGDRELVKLPAMQPTGAIYGRDGHLYVCTAQDSKLHKLNKAGQRLKSTITGQFNFPNGIVLTEDNKLCVCDSQQDRIRIFDTDLNYQDSITTISVKAGVQCTPTDIDTDKDGNLYVVEHGNQRVVVLNRRGEQVQTIGARRTGSLLHGMSFSSLSTPSSPGRLSKPAGVKVFGDHVYVTDWESGCVFVFTRDEGDLVTSFGGGVLTHPEGLTIDDDGFIYVAHNRKEVVKF